MHVLGIDGGGTKTIAVLMDDRRRILGCGEAGSANYQTVGLEAAYFAIETAISKAVMSFPDVEINGIGLGLAGAGRAEDRAAIASLIDRLQSRSILAMRWSLVPSGIAILPDCEIALAGGLEKEVGIAIIAGTGSIVWGCNAAGDTYRVGGWGYLLGDEGSGYDIARKALQAVMRSRDGRAPKTVLADLVCQQLQLQNLDELIPLVYRGGWGTKDMASLSFLVDRAARENDGVAIDILTVAARELHLATTTTIAALFSPQEAIEIATVGGVWRSHILRDRYCELMGHSHPRANAIVPRQDPAWGAAYLALQAIARERRERDSNPR